VSDWVDVFAPAIWEQHRPAGWPEVVVVDSQALFHKQASAKKSSVAFHVLAAATVVNGKPVLLAAQASPKRDTAAFAALFASLPGAPGLLVCDGAREIPGGARLAFGANAPVTFRCEWHLWKNALDMMPAKLKAEVTAERSHPVRLARERAFTDQAGFHHMVETVHVHAAALGLSTRRFDGWVSRNEMLVAAQAGAAQHFRGPRSNGCVETVLRQVDQRIWDRAAQFTNKQRLDRLLALMACELNGHARPLEWADVIRRTVALSGGYAADQRGAVDPRSSPSLR
jgi:hypothetical protein